MSSIKPPSLQVLVSAFIFGLVVVLSRVALDGGAAALTVVTVRALGVVLLVSAILALSGAPLRLPPRERYLALAVGALFSINNFSITYAVGLMPVPLVILVFYTYPVLTSIATWLKGEERPNVRSVSAMILALSGLTLALGADITAANPEGLAFAGLAAVCWTAVMLLNGHFFRAVDPRPLTLHLQGAVAGILVIATIVTGSFRLPDLASGWVALGALPFAYATAIVGLLAAAATLGPAKSAFYMNFEPIAAITLSAVFLGQGLNGGQAIGAAMVIAALFLFRPLRRAPPSSPGGMAPLAPSTRTPGKD